MRDLICFGEDWNRHASTGQFLVRRLLDHGFRVIWVDSLGWRAPRLTRGDLARMVRKLRTASRGAQCPHPNLIVHTPLVLPWHRHAAVRRINAALVARGVRRLVRRHGFSRYTVMTTYPAPVDAIARLDPVRRVYYCADLYETMPGLDTTMVRLLEDRLMRSSDVVVTTSRALYEAKAAVHGNVVYLPHGVDIEHFRPPAAGAAPPPELRTLPRPIIGFHGLIQNLIDVDIIDRIAASRPDWSVVLIGRMNFDAGALPARPNIHYLGERPYEEIPSYIHAFDAALIPYRPVERMRYANPIKLMEYLAAGKPVVSTPTAVVKEFEDVVRIAATPEGFVSGIQEALTEDDGAVEARLARVRHHTWAARAERLAGLLA